jgi:glutaredoxin
VEVKGRVIVNKSKTFFIALIVIVLLSGIATAAIYKWVDEKGRTHYSDYPPQDMESTGKFKVIPADRSGSRSGTGSEDKPPIPKSSSYREPLSSDESQPPRVPNVELYTTSWCSYCKKARNYFNSRGIPFTEYDIEKDKSAARRKKRLDTRRGVPFAVINGHRIHGFVKVAYDRALREKQ